MPNKIAIMQPYIFPYLGYFQLVNAVDTFVFYDDVNFIKRGWINRNKILVNGKEKLVSFPCIQASQNKLIKEVGVNLEDKAYTNFLQTIEQAYKKAPNFTVVFELITNIFKQQHANIASLAAASCINISTYLGLGTQFMVSSENFSSSKGMQKQNRLIHITNETNSSTYINTIGGRELYSKEDFRNEGIDLFFLQPKLPQYKQLSCKFIPGLSIIDVLMMNSKDEVKEMLNKYDLV